MPQNSRALWTAFHLCIGLSTPDDLTREQWELLGWDYYRCVETGFPAEEEVKSVAANIVLLAIRDGVEKHA